MDTLGTVEGPALVLPDGADEDEVVWSATPETVAIVDGGDVVAVGLGEAVVTGQWGGQSVSWSLTVEPSVALRFVDPPEGLAVGERKMLALEARVEGEVVDPGPLVWKSTDEATLEVSATGEVVAVAPGKAYVTVSRGSSEAMVELVVR